MQPASLEDPLYYLRNAEQVVDWCLHTYADLLTVDERQLLQGWQQLDDQPKALLIRLVMRKGELFRADKLNYSEIPELEAAISTLSALGLVEIEPHITGQQMASVLVKQELWHTLTLLFPETPLPKQINKAELLIRAQSLVGDKPLSQWWPDSSIKLVGLSCNSLFERLRLLFFGNLHQDWSEFVLTELGLQQYEKVDLSRDQRAFQSIAEIDFMLTIDCLWQRLEEGEPVAQLLDDVPADIEVPWLQEKLQQLLFSLGHGAERAGEIELALNLYQRSNTNEAKVRRLRVMEKHRSAEATWQCSQEFLQQVTQPATRLLLQRVAMRSGKKLGHSFVAEQPKQPIQDSLLLPFDENISVEQAVINHYQATDWRGFHVENDLFTSLFGLLFWQAIYAPVPGAFFHPFQARPKDLYSSQFYVQRAELIGNAMSSLVDGSYQQIIRHRWQQKQGITNRFLNWRLLSPELLECALQSIPAEHLQRVFKHMLTDLRHHCSGMPDLVLFNQQTNTYELVEVKGPGDRLQEHQKFWLDFYQRNNLPAKVVYVQWIH